MRWIKTTVNVHSIKTKLTAYFLLLSLLPIVIFVFFSGNYYLQGLQKNVMAYTYEVIERVDKNIETYISDIDNILNIRNDYYILQYLKLSDSNDIDENRKYTMRMWENFNNLKKMKTDLADIRVIAPNGQTISCYGMYWTDLNSESVLLNLAANPQNEIAIIPPRLNIMNKNVFTIGKAINSANLSGKSLMCIDIDVMFLNRICNDIRFGQNGYVYLSDQSGGIIHFPFDTGKPEQNRLLIKNAEVLKQENGSFIDAVDGVNYIVTFKTSKSTGWKIIGISPETELTQEIDRIKTVSLFMILGCVLVVLLLTAYLSSIVTNPIRELRSLMKRAAENELSIHATIKTKDEIGQLATSFNIMMDRIRGLVDEIVHDQQKIRKMEMKAMQELIKPHFVYNTLDSIIGLLEQNRNEDAMSLVETLGKFFRTSLSHGKEVISVREEIDNVKNYLQIQQFRFSNKFDFLFEIEEDVFRYNTIKFVLQPLVENSIYHGIRGLEKKGLILVKGYARDQQLILEVFDNGFGIQEDKLSQINRVLCGEECVSQEDVYFGIRNVNDRLKLTFGKEFGLVFQRIDHSFTKATINQPLI